MTSKRANQFLVITFTNPEGSLLHLKYQLYDHCLREKWVSLMLHDFDKRKVEEGGVFYGKRFHSEEQLANTLNKCIKIINHYAEKFNSSKLSIPLKAQLPMTIEFLNTAHKYFEKIAPTKTINLVPELRRAVEDLNVTIHQAEAFTSLGDFPTDHIEVVLIPRGGEKLADEDFKLFTPDNKFGGLYLSYGTIGVPTKNAYLMNTEPVTQKVYNTGMMLSFMDDFKFVIDDNFRKWLTKYNLSADDPKSAIGNIPLGMLVEPEIKKREEFLAELSGFRKVIGVHFVE